MTKPPAPPRKPARRWIDFAALAAILTLAAALRLRGIGFGLPALNDPDEPLFMMTAIDMLQRGSLNPGWFGHPGTTTLYSLAATIAATACTGVASGRFADIQAFAQAVYADPGIVFLPARVMIALCGTACVWLTWRLGRNLGGPRLGLLASAFLAINAVHVAWSQVIRTDVQASLFMLAATLSAVAIARAGRTRDYLLAGLFVGLACATKWPAALAGFGPLCAGLGWLREDRRKGARGLAAFVAASLGALLLASPYLLLDHETALRNLSGEARPTHPGATGGGAIANLGWYAAHPLLGSFGIGGLLLAALGTAWGPTDRRVWNTAVLPGFLAFVLVVAWQDLRWERWAVPLLPFFCLAAARALCGCADLLRGRAGHRRWIEPAAFVLLAWPMLQAGETRAAERAHDTRQAAAAWARAHIPAGASILVEHGAFDLFAGPWALRFPLGASGCVDVRRLLAGQVRYSAVEKQRKGSPIVDLAHVDPARLDTCRTDYAILTHDTRYAPGSPERRLYDRAMAGRRLIAVFHPRPGASSGPVVRIFAPR